MSYNHSRHTFRDGALFYSSADVFIIKYQSWVKRPSSVDLRPAERVTTSATDGGRFIMKHRDKIKLYRDAEWLRQKYWDEKSTMQEMAELANCSCRSILRWMVEYDIPRRLPSEYMITGDSPPYHNAEWLRQKYWDEGLSAYKIAVLPECKCGRTTIDKWLRRHNIPRRSSTEGLVKDLIGRSFGRWTVLKRAPGRPGAHWLCRCDCGAEQVNSGIELRRGHTKSCGCYRREWAASQCGEKSSGWKGGKPRTSSGYVHVRVPDHLYADGKGYILEHRLVMEEHLGRYLEPEETVHHKNGIRDDNCIENLELWTSRHPAGQRVIDLVDFAYEILSRYDPTAFTL